MKPRLFHMSDYKAEGLPAGAFVEQENLTPRNRRVRPWESTKFPSTVWTKFGGVRSPVAGEVAGISGILLRGLGRVMRENKEEKGTPGLLGARDKSRQESNDVV